MMKPEIFQDTDGKWIVTLHNELVLKFDTSKEAHLVGASLETMYRKGRSDLKREFRTLLGDVDPKG